METCLHLLAGADIELIRQSAAQAVIHKVRIYKEYHSVCPLV
jgi:hypothetical protein